MYRHTDLENTHVEVTPLTNRAFRSTRGLTGGLTLLFVALTIIGLSACGAPAYTYVADGSAGTYYKVPSQWHQLSQKNLDAALTAEGLSGDGIWSTAFDAATAPSADDFLAPDLSQPFVFAEVGTLSSTATTRSRTTCCATSCSRSPRAPGRQDDQLPADRLQVAAGPDDHRRRRACTGFARRSSTPSPPGRPTPSTKTSLTNADQTVVYFLLVHCTNACYEQNQSSINTVMTSFTIGSPT